MGRSSENICSSIGGERKEGDETQFTTKISGNTSLSPIISFCKISFPVMHLMAYVMLKPAVLAPSSPVITDNFNEENKFRAPNNLAIPLTCKRNQTEAYIQLTKPSYTNQC